MRQIALQHQERIQETFINNIKFSLKKWSWLGFCFLLLHTSIKREKTNKQQTKNITPSSIKHSVRSKQHSFIAQLSARVQVCSTFLLYRPFCTDKYKLTEQLMWKTISTNWKDTYRNREEKRGAAKNACSSESVHFIRKRGVTQLLMSSEHGQIHQINQCKQQIVCIGLRCLKRN